MPRRERRERKKERKRWERTKKRTKGEDRRRKNNAPTIKTWSTIKGSGVCERREKDEKERKCVCTSWRWDNRIYILYRDRCNRHRRRERMRRRYQSAWEVEMEGNEGSKNKKNKRKNKKNQERGGGESNLLREEEKENLLWCEWCVCKWGVNGCVSVSVCLGSVWILIPVLLHVGMGVREESRVKHSNREQGREKRQRNTKHTYFSGLLVRDFSLSSLFFFAPFSLSSLFLFASFSLGSGSRTICVCVCEWVRERERIDKGEKRETGIERSCVPFSFSSFSSFLSLFDLVLRLRLRLH